MSDRQWQSAPDRDGWWLWSENQDRDAFERLLVIGGEIATDDDLADELDDGDYDGTPRDDNCWEMTAVEDMGGVWSFDAERRLIPCRP